MTPRTRVAAFHSPGHDYGAVLGRLRQAYPDARVTAVAPSARTVAGLPDGAADDVLETGTGGAATRRRMLEAIRAQRFDVFVVMFPSPKLRMLAALSGARQALWCAPDGRLEPLSTRVPRVLAEETARLLMGRMTYAWVWAAVRIVHTPRLPRR